MAELWIPILDDITAISTSLTVLRTHTPYSYYTLFSVDNINAVAIATIVRPQAKKSPDPCGDGRSCAYFSFRMVYSFSAYVVSLILLVLESDDVRSTEYRGLFISSPPGFQDSSARENTICPAQLWSVQYGRICNFAQVYVENNVIVRPEWDTSSLSSLFSGRLLSYNHYKGPEQGGDQGMDAAHANQTPGIDDKARALMLPSSHRSQRAGEFASLLRRLGIGRNVSLRDLSSSGSKGGDITARTIPSLVGIQRVWVFNDFEDAKLIVYPTLIVNAPIGPLQEHRLRADSFRRRRTGCTSLNESAKGLKDRVKIIRALYLCLSLTSSHTHSLVTSNQPASSIRLQGKINHGTKLSYNIVPFPPETLRGSRTENMEAAFPGRHGAISAAVVGYSIRSTGVASP
ncbi:hypothetical protein PCH_Pc22g08900 [Penicillium rubens Wisconsin 54-1255]|uniref:Uncharacterized protein n=1 Tax=Penicillium rubens (strain ATCC 28089 / DSM 1075 / NRRL 1951 / Wisconsin 54-1255) TaxID=500485 RepID=B6HT49_PENRW|nr:hypothetical protein PCH_Pc22g08900 [Penicillium rubens Wisconsin 54-1255]